MKLYAGTSGFSYKEWKGSFYPEKLAAKKMLNFYADHFQSVEINSTFYRMPKRETLESWVEQVPAGFRFVVPASRRITHIGRLKEVEDSTAYLFSQLEGLGDALGPVLVQLHPNMKINLERLDAFLASIPTGRRLAFEFRQATWTVDEVKDRLRDHGHACCVAGAEQDDIEARMMEEIVSTADFGYLRLRRCDYTEAEIKDWAKRIKAQDWKEVYVFFKHEDEGTGPDLAQKFVTAFEAL